MRGSSLVHAVTSTLSWPVCLTLNRFRREISVKRVPSMWLLRQELDNLIRNRVGCPVICGHDVVGALAV